MIHTPRVVIHGPVFLISAAAIAAVLTFGLAFTATAERVFLGLQDWISVHFGWLYVLSVTFFLFYALYILFSRFSHVRLGPDDSRPDFPALTWFAMLFSAGMGIGLLFFGVAEPVSHFLNPPYGEGGTMDAARLAMRISFFHWGLHAWAVYIVMGLTLAYFGHRKGLPLSIRSSLYPLIGNRIHGPIGNLVDIVAVFGTVFGLATSLGLGARQINAGLAHLWGVPATVDVQILLIGVITACATISVVLGLGRGIRRLSELNLVLAGALLLFVFVLGPTLFILESFPDHLGSYLQQLVATSLWTDSLRDSEWQKNWTFFYWAWWIAWSPFVGTFVARVSRGRTIREFVLGVLLVPSGVTFIWFSIFGGAALHEQMFAGGGIAEAVQQNIDVAIYELLARFPLTELTSFLAIAVVWIFFVTSSDSGSFVVDMLTSGGHQNPPVWQRVFWAVTEGVVAAVLLLTGGLKALQSAAIITGLPFAVVLIVMCFSLVKALRADPAVTGESPAARGAPR